MALPVDGGRPPWRWRLCVTGGHIAGRHPSRRAAAHHRCRCSAARPPRWVGDCGRAVQLLGRSSPQASSRPCRQMLASALDSSGVSEGPQPCRPQPPTRAQGWRSPAGHRRRSRRPVSPAPLPHLPSRCDWKQRRGVLARSRTAATPSAFGWPLGAARPRVPSPLHATQPSRRWQGHRHGRRRRSSSRRAQSPLTRGSHHGQGAQPAGSPLHPNPRRVRPRAEPLDSLQQCPRWVDGMPGYHADGQDRRRVWGVPTAVRTQRLRERAWWR